MNLKQALHIAAQHQRPSIAASDPFAGLPDNIVAEMRALLEPCQRAGVLMEADPRIPHTIGVALEGQLFRVSIATNRDTGGQRVVIFGPDMTEWDRATFLALVPEQSELPVGPKIVRSAPQPDRKGSLEHLADHTALLTEIRDLLRRMAG